VNGDDAFRSQDGQGDISPNVLMPSSADRHASVRGSTIIDLTAQTDRAYVGLPAFGYTSTQGSERAGEIGVTRATITATPLVD
jgi:hypothetical protein